MSQVYRTICDKCKKFFEKDEVFYHTASDISEFREGQDCGEKILNSGDYCKKCLIETIEKHQ